MTDYYRTKLHSTAMDDIVETLKEELIPLRGKPELVDRLESLVVKYPGIEVNMNLYRTIFPFPLDSFQEKGLESLISGNNVIVMTPTGSGKTLVGELAIYFALMLGLRVAYTTPLKALSNQKFNDFRNKFGADRVALLTGDVAINRGAAVTIMTTEVFRNMVYDADSQNQLSNLFMVCFDEFHFMNDPERGTVWEESVISCPPSVRILALSATMGNVDEIQGWMSSIHGNTDLVQSQYRPVPLRYFFAMRQGLFPLFRDPNAGPGALAGVTRSEEKETFNQLEEGCKINPTIVKLEEQLLRSKSNNKGGKYFRNNQNRNSNSNAIPKYSDVADELRKLQKTPAIFFIFSRSGCEEAANQVMKSGIRLLGPDDVTYVNEALAAFIRQNPMIPIVRSNVVLLQAGVGVHHAGLIPVWKSLIEDLFNANKIKVLFATETLAAGVNMPARATVISTVTKRINSQTIKLKTSQMLQMAGRAGRRGKDTEGSVILMRNRFEDASMGHKILTSPIDGVKSHFRASYSLTVTLLETKTIQECRALIEKGFGAYLLQKKIEKKGKANETKDQYRSILQKYGLKEAREFIRLLRKIEKQKQSYAELISNTIETEQDLVSAVVDFMPMGMGLELRNGVKGYFLGDVIWRDGSAYIQTENNAKELETTKKPKKDNYSGYALITREGQLYIARREHIRCFAQSHQNLAIDIAQTLLELIPKTGNWEMTPIDGFTTTLRSGKVSEKVMQEHEEFIVAMEFMHETPPFETEPLPGSMQKAQQVLDNLRQELSQHPVVINGDDEMLTKAMIYVSELRDPASFVNANNGKDKKENNEIIAWTMFKSVTKILKKFGALTKEDKATEFGQMVASLSADNELWLALIATNPIIAQLDANEFAGLISTTMIDEYKAQNGFFKKPAPKKVMSAVNALMDDYVALKTSQAVSGLEFPILMSPEISGIVTEWAKGISWRELCSMTSLDQGDLCRILRRTIEVLRQLPEADNIDPFIAVKAQDAAIALDRFPVTDNMEAMIADANSTSSSSFLAAGEGFAPEIDVLTGEPIAATASDARSSTIRLEKLMRELSVLDGSDDFNDNDAEEMEEVSDVATKKKRKRRYDDEFEDPFMDAPIDPDGQGDSDIDSMMAELQEIEGDDSVLNEADKDDDEDSDDEEDEDDEDEDDDDLDDEDEEEPRLSPEQLRRQLERQKIQALKYGL